MLEIKELRRIPRFSGLPEKAELFLAERIKRSSYKKGEMIFLEGEENNRFHIVEEGEVKVYKTLESGREIILGIFNAGEALGEVAILDAIDMPASAVAQEPTSVLSMTSQDYILMLEKYPEVAMRIIRDLSLRLRTLRKHIEMLGENGIATRIAHLLVTYARQNGRQINGDGVLVPLHLTRAEMASMVSARIETVIRIMSRWHKKNIVHSVPEGFHIPNIQILEAIIHQEED
ncbi:MAG: Crp/Fnr family transcriptional regulator [Deltaproteobacteria bacterium]|nr:Crp/Fnr family transcriptional regulator [Deltaproteobacteria bacterium]